MWPYWLLFIAPALMAIQRKRIATPLARAQWGHELWIFWCGLVLLIGLRNEIGSDWFSYLRYLDDSSDLDLIQVFALGDPGYIAVNWLCNQLNLGIAGVNLICGAIFTTGLIVFCRSLQRPWLALTVAVPYLVIVIGMGYTRQATAMGLIMIGLVSLTRGNFGHYLVLVILASTFHKTAIVTTIFAIAVVNPRNIYQLPLIGIAFILGYLGFVQNSLDGLQQTYFEVGLTSTGTLNRLLIGALPALIYLFTKGAFEFNVIQKKLWALMSVFSLLMLIAYFFSESSTAIDRMALYLIPLQLAIISNLPDALRHKFRVNKVAWIILVITFYGVILFVWMFFATHAPSWIPYRTHLSV